MIYTLIKTLHLLAAIAFVGTLFVQVVILWSASRSLDGSVRQQLSQGIGQRARKVIHWVALVLYGAGFMLAMQYKPLLADPSATRFGTLLSIKILLALLIIGHYVALIFLRRGSRIGERGMHLLNISLLVHAVLVVVIAKFMFVL